jgi:hypothetical protein
MTPLEFNTGYVEIYFLEPVASVHGHGKWVLNLGILAQTSQLKAVRCRVSVRRGNSDIVDT